MSSSSRERFVRTVGTASGILFMLAMSASPATASDGWISSGERQVQLVELYSSEGCSSCPPAERLISAWVDAPGLWTRFIPVNLHVDYWDRLGWPDRFASAAYTRRQRDYVEAGRIPNPYTPCFLVDGREWKGFFRGQRSIPTADAPRVGVLKLRLVEEQIEAVFNPIATSGEPLEVHVAILGFDLSSEVRAGENRGRTLVQNFVAMGHASGGAAHEEGVHRLSLSLPVRREDWPKRAALIGWISRPGDPSPVQAAGAPLPGVVDRGTSR